MANFAEYIKESFTELKEKVTWPTWSELQNSAVITLVAALIIALIVFAMDESAGNLIKLIYKSFA
ncbi:preprotein translocase, SecE subunit [Pseudopedobacter saltans DSM 12145]|uniref:Protein translocase subunit SecE n=1 Tax=Pseudopedobacter saltans (strain ATCC 51119 / DSM 12145 / JCM 21818 / CCUG 39354 / LMG 10337 / NBRC 100064 / NCIMB 13643) TaxID=762903 RepID=F0SCI5_PSESL|nr:preprotein translocase subunit SecE [Pseudopedobacter saltans]ADY52819.1 preprotein translocase, SecE subunit [Pseudopedobacter saltans DSM 12145]